MKLSERWWKIVELNGICCFIKLMLKNIFHFYLNRTNFFILAINEN